MIHKCTYVHIYICNIYKCKVNPWFNQNNNNRTKCQSEMHPYQSCVLKFAQGCSFARNCSGFGF